MQAESSAPQRAWQRLPESTIEFTAVTWNCLADSLANGFAGVSPEALAWKHRAPLLARELWSCLGTEVPHAVPAVIALQEVDEQCVTELVAAAQLGDYERIYVRKGAAEDVQNWQRTDQLYEPMERPDGGMLVLHNLARFYPECAPVAERVVRYRGEHGEPQSQRGLVLSFGTSGLHVAATHLKAGPAFSSVRCDQLVQLMSELDDLTARRPNRNSAPSLLLMGDLNEDKTGTLYQDAVFMQGLTDAYDKLLQWTTAKTRSDGTVKRCVEDYIFFEGAITVKSVYTCALEASNAQPTQLVSAAYPSDHLLLAAACRL